MPLPWAYGHVCDSKIRRADVRLGTRLHVDRGVRRCPRPTAGTSPAAPSTARLPGSSPRRGKPCRRHPRCAPARNSAHAAAGDRLWFRVPAPQAPALKPHGTLGVKRIAGRQTHNLPEQFCSSDHDPKKHCHPVNCFTAFCVLSKISSGSKIENMEGREMSVSMVKYFSTNAICYVCICLILYCIFITFTVRVGLWVT